MTTTHPTQQPFPSPMPVNMAPSAPIPFMPPMASAVPTLPPQQPAFHAQAPASYPMSNGLPYAQPSVPVVGITPSQMVANVFGSATQPQPVPVPVPVQQTHTLQPSPFSTPPLAHLDARSMGSPFGKPPLPPVVNPAIFQPPNGNATFNGADSWASPSSSAPPLPAQHQADAFEAQWAALESRSRQRTTPSPTNPFSSELQKTFEIQLWKKQYYGVGGSQKAGRGTWRRKQMAGFGEGLRDWIPLDTHTILATYLSLIPSLSAVKCELSRYQSEREGCPWSSEATETSNWRKVSDTLLHLFPFRLVHLWPFLRWKCFMSWRCPLPFKNAAWFGNRPRSYTLSCLCGPIFP